MEPFSPILTPRLSLREFFKKDAPALLNACRQSPAIAAMHSHQLTGPGPVRRYLDCLTREYSRGLHRTLAVALLPDDKLVGMISLQIHPAFPRGEIGYWIAPDFQGRGLASEAAKALVEYGFREQQLHRIQGMHFPENPASGRVLQNAGMRYEGTLKDYVLVDGEWKDCLMYAAVINESSSAPDMQKDASR